MFYMGKKRLLPQWTRWIHEVHKPKSIRKIFLPNPNRKHIKPRKTIEKQTRTNYFNIQMIPPKIHKQIFKNTQKPQVNPTILEECMRNLINHKMAGKSEDYNSEINIEIPPLLGNNIEEHFKIIGEQQIASYRQLVLDLLQGIPEMPQKWQMKQGWTRYEPGKKPEPVSYPLEQAIVFDVEVCMSAGKAPTLATAVTSQAWYGWVSQSLIDGTSKAVTNHQYSEEELIPMESTVKKQTEHTKKPKIVIGHNVSYDRARIREQYWLEKTGTRFLDTMSLHICVSGLSSYQRAILKSSKTSEQDELWMSQSSLNNLSDVHNLYCGEMISKSTRDLFVDGQLTDIQYSFQEVMSYCGLDVLATFNILKQLFPLFLERFPHPVTLAGMLELGTAYLPINANWNRYLGDSEQTFEDLDIEGRVLLAKRADQACQLLHDNKFKEDLWMWDQDWDVKKIKLKKTATNIAIEEEDVEINSDEEIDELKEKFKYIWETSKYLPTVKTLLPGYPNWYRKLCTKSDSSPDWKPGPNLISTSMKVTPKLLALTWDGYPLHHIRDKGWGFLVPFTDDCGIESRIPLKQLLEKCPLLKQKLSQSSNNIDITKEVQENLARKEYYSKVKEDKTQGLYKGTGIFCNTQLENCCWFIKLPHKNGVAHNVGNPLSKDFLNKFSENVLAGDTESAEKVLTIARMLSYWRNNRDRIFDQMIVWLNPTNLKYDNNVGAILPQVVVCGTLTRRAVEPTWMTAANAHPERVGSELRAMVQAPSGYSIVGADVDSQELWIASVIGDAHCAKVHGATPFGWMTLSGTKANETDMHSVTAKTIGISRDDAKVINYARIYGAGQNFAERLLKQFNPSISEREARSKAVKMFNLTKGKRMYHLKKEYLEDLPDQAYTKWQAFELAKKYGKTTEELFEKPYWIGGTESAMFNRLEEIANNPLPKTPFLNSSLSRALEPKSISDDIFLPTRINWVVQSGAVDFLHLMLVCMKWLMGDRVRFCLSFHDEIRYLVEEKYKYQTALAMHLTNLLTRAFCSSRLGIYDLPMSVAFFSSVEIDKVLRKDAKQDCRTPSNPHGLNKGYGIANGESLDIYEAVKKAGHDWFK